MRIGLATLRFRPEPEEALQAVLGAMRDAAAQGAKMICTAECYLPGLRGVGLEVAPPDAGFQSDAERRIRDAAATLGVGAVIGVERVEPGRLIASALVVGPDGALLGHQDKVQIDPDEEGTYVAAAGRNMFEVGGVRFGVAICHEGWRYPETVRWAAQRGAHIVFHPQFSPSGPPRQKAAWACAEGTMHEKAAICRAAENSIYFATVNYAIENPIAGTALIDPEGNVRAAHLAGTEYLLVADIDIAAATGLLARRFRSAA
ncbi:carbon-nitrogen hydrolase family protein [Desertibaculum subflavum]|uniref:carbon-nitrogen hydrolase family protein n=1 Tax=Desertibaculum subflavum TaxID=2268458 RepID=UPI0013C5354D